MSEIRSNTVNTGAVWKNLLPWMIRSEMGSTVEASARRSGTAMRKSPIEEAAPNCRQIRVLIDRTQRGKPQRLPVRPG